jgi:hypothetical protein
MPLEQGESFLLRGERRRTRKGAETTPLPEVPAVCGDGVGAQTPLQKKVGQKIFHRSFKVI